jgi:hypothetical protein
MRRNLQLALLLLIGAGLIGSVYTTRLSAADFSRDVRPILSKYCFQCHGPDDAKRQSGLRLDDRGDALAPADSGEKAIVPSDAQASELVKRILSADADLVMPPPETKMELSDEQKRTLQEWIAEGAPYAEHWAFKTPVRPMLPSPKGGEWASNPIDLFVLDKLQQLGLEPTAQASPETLLRRVYVDLIGLPPTEAEVEAFLKNPSTQHYEQIVERLLSTPAYGERWSRRWLDLARYADTNGYEKDRVRNVWPYRDWVIDALNSDMPFDQFTLKQLAGDLLPGATLSDRVATGFHRNTMLNEEGGIDPLEFRFHAMVDRIGTTATVWMGMTVACAQCHNHKYDPISQREYYQMMAYLNNADEPELELVDERLEQQRREVQTQIAGWQATAATRYPVDLPEVQWLPADISASASDGGATFQKLRDGTWLVGGQAADKDVYRLKIKLPQKEGWVTGLRLETYADGSLPKTGPGRAPNGNLVLSDIKARLPDPISAGTSIELQWSGATTNHTQTGFSAENAVDGNPKTGWALDPIPPLANWQASWYAANPIYQAGGEQPGALEVDLEQLYGGQHLIGRFRLLIGYAAAETKPADIAAATRELTARSLDKAFAAWQQASAANPTRWHAVVPVSTEANMAKLRQVEDMALLAEGDQSKRDWYRLSFAAQDKPVHALLIEAIPDEQLPKKGPGRIFYEGPAGDFFLSEVTALGGGQAYTFAAAEESFSGGGKASASIDGDPLSGWSINGGQGKRHFAAFRFQQPIPAGQAIDLTLLFERYYSAPLGKFRIWFSDGANEKLLTQLPPEFSPAETASDQALAEKLKQQYGQRELYFARTSPLMSVWRNQLEQLQQKMSATTTALVMRERPSDVPRATFVHHRGEFLSPKEEVKAGGPAFLPAVVKEGTGNRLDFAKWLVRSDHPLVARVVINRNWSLLMGRGLVVTEEDFGYQGSMPTHPELLDWMARQWIDGNSETDPNRWSSKWLHRWIVTSSTYKQGSEVDALRLEKDPDNRWFSRGPRKRMEAEQLRDTLLSVSGLLDRKMHGPSVFPPQPASVTTEGAYGQLAWNVSPGGDRYRRGLYTFAKRTAPYAMFQTFDGPSGEACLAKRTPTNTPLQALTLLNDSVVLETSQSLGRWAAAQAVAAGSDQTAALSDTVKGLFVRILSRQPDENELQAVLEFWQAEQQRLGTDVGAIQKICGGPADAAQAGWVLVARALLNTDEFLTRN